MRYQTKHRATESGKSHDGFLSFYYSYSSALYPNGFEEKIRSLWKFQGLLCLKHWWCGYLQSLSPFSFCRCAYRQSIRDHGKGETHRGEVGCHRGHLPWNMWKRKIVAQTQLVWKLTSKHQWQGKKWFWSYTQTIGKNFENKHCCSLNQVTLCLHPKWHPH